MSLAMLTAAGAALAVPSTTTEAPVALAGAPAGQAEDYDAELLALSGSEAAEAISAREAALALTSSRSASRDELPDKTLEPQPEPEPEVVGARFATAGVNVRKAPNTDAKVVDVLDHGDKVRVTDQKDDGWRQVMRKGETYWVNADYLSKSKPKAPAPAPARSSGSSSSSGVSTAACSNGSSASGGANVVAVHRAVCAQFPQITNYGTYRGGSGAHGSGRAIDIMVSGSTGQQVADYVRANASRLGVTEVIYAQRIWTTQRAGDGWRGMSNRGSATANHYDHVHVTVR
jgi:SH3-like domain-containing protein